MRFQRFIAASNTILIILLSLILALSIVGAVTGRSATHSQIVNRLDNIERELVYQSCVQLIPIAERTPEAVAECRIPVN